MKKLFYFRKEVIFFFFLFLVCFNVSAQNVISRLPGHYPEGEVPVMCETDPFDPACYTGTIILKPAIPGVDYHFQIPLISEPRANCLFTVVQTTPCESGSPIPNSTTGDLDMPAATRCIPLGSDNFLEIEVNVNVIAGPNAGQSDYQKYRIPVLRDPVKVALVLDISGSMGWVIPGGTDIRWNVLKKAVELFVEKLEISQQVGDEIALTYFTTNLVTPNPPLDAGFIDITEQDANPSTTDTITKDMNSRVPLSATAMGLGLLDGKNKLGNNDPSTNRKIVLLFTDGIQNVHPKVNDDGRTFSTVSDILNDCPCSELDSVYYYSIGLGSSTLVPAILSQISDANGGISLSITTGADTEPEIHNFFQNQFANMLEGGSPQIVSRKIGDLSSGNLTYKFQINNVVSRVFFELIHDENSNINVTIKKDGLALDDYTIEKTGDFYKLVNIELPIISDEVIYGGGEWEVVVSGESSNPFYLTCFTDDHFLKYHSGLNKPIYKTGDTIKFNSDLIYAGSPLISTDDSISVVLIKPGDDIGHLLATYETELTDTLTDYTDDAQNKLVTLLNNDESFYSALLPEEQIINLDNNGDGTFSGIYTNTNLTGVYQAIFLMKGEIPEVGKFERLNQLSMVMEFGLTVGETPGIFIDNTPPTKPVGLAAANITQSSVVLNWESSTDNVGVYEYKIFKNGDLLSSTPAPNLTLRVDNLNPNNTYSFSVKACDGSNNLSNASNEISVTTLNIPDTEKPTPPTHLAASNIAQTNLYLNWDISTDNVGITEYVIYKNEDAIASTSGNSYSVTNLNSGANYTFFVVAKDAAQNQSEKSNIISVVTLDQPANITAPTKLTANNITQNSLDLSWNASKGGRGEIQYNIYQDASLIAKTNSTTYSVSHLKASTNYTFHTIAQDTEGNISDVSNTALITTLSEDNVSTGNYITEILKIRPKNKYGYYMGPGLKTKIKFKYLPKVPGEPVAHSASLEGELVNNELLEEPYLKQIIDNLDGSYYLVIGNVIPKTNPQILITVADEVLYEGPMKAKIPVWFYILIILILIILIVLRKYKTKTLKITLWILFVALLVILYLHKTGVLHFL
ncbi:MAG: fibronectin type III domain-containing protein [Bacteroidetes bacterium]|nr:fibronectin type III domain-containing protein [Bacteroidota bacterium]